jgi:hypothetical protein
MGTASAGYPFGITAHSHEKIGSLPHRMDCSSSSFPLLILVDQLQIPWLVDQPIILDTKWLLSKLECWCFKKMLGKFNFVVHNLAIFFW